jgi:hypothetical protein
MKRAAVIAACCVLVATGAVALASSGLGARTASLAQALRNTTHVSSQRYAMHVTITRGKLPATLNVRGAIAPGTMSVRIAMTAVTLPGGTKVPGPDGAALLDGPFLYLRAPSSVVVFGKIHWLREPVSSLRPTSSELRSVRAMSPAPLLHVLAESHSHPNASGRVFRGTVAYDDPIVLTALRHLTSGLEFQALHVTAWVGRDGLVHRIALDGHTADGSATLHFTAHLFAFGRAVSVTPPKPGTFIDKRLLGLDE